ncbi:5-carboxymethyl-2-hydroxymuconate Delta-isomerase [Pseudomonas sp. NA-150]|uniref:5-carboxymethyl-2-hydroxymuconate Delta-isomerase n=1 Tax=Pseudomonas sp. NA-150 TaxID=3367525 RepID=UPI0037C55678
MPHVTMEYTANLPQLDVAKTLLVLNQTLLISGHFGAEMDIKNRAIPLEFFQVGTTAASRGFVHVKLALLSGRSAEVKKVLSESLLTALRDSATWPAEVEVQLSVEVVDLDRESYAKAVIRG